MFESSTIHSILSFCILKNIQSLASKRSLRLALDSSQSGITWDCIRKFVHVILIWCFSMSQTCRPMVSYLFVLFWLAWCPQWLRHFFDKFPAVGASSACQQTFSGMWHVKRHTNLYSCVKACCMFGTLLERHEQGQKDYLQQFCQLQKIICRTA